MKCIVTIPTYNFSFEQVLALSSKIKKVCEVFNLKIFSCEATLDNTQNVAKSLTPSLHHYRNYMFSLQFYCLKFCTELIS